MATVVLTAITDYDLQGFKLSATAYANPRDTKDVSADITVKDYTLTVSSDQPTLDAWTAAGEGNYDSMVVTVTGGRSGSQLSLDRNRRRPARHCRYPDRDCNLRILTAAPAYHRLLQRAVRKAAVNVKAEGLGSSDTLDADVGLQPDDLRSGVQLNCRHLTASLRPPITAKPLPLRWPTPCRAHA